MEKSIDSSNQGSRTWLQRIEANHDMKDYFPNQRRVYSLQEGEFVPDLALSTDVKTRIGQGVYSDTPIKTDWRWPMATANDGSWQSMPVRRLPSHDLVARNSKITKMVRTSVPDRSYRSAVTNWKKLKEPAVEGGRIPTDAAVIRRIRRMRVFDPEQQEVLIAGGLSHTRGGNQYYPTDLNGHTFSRLTPAGDDGWNLATWRNRAPKTGDVFHHLPDSLDARVGFYRRHSYYFKNSNTVDLTTVSPNGDIVPTSDTAPENNFTTTEEFKRSQRLKKSAYERRATANQLEEDELNATNWAGRQLFYMDQAQVQDAAKPFTGELKGVGGSLFGDAAGTAVTLGGAALDRFTERFNPRPHFQLKDLSDQRETVGMPDFIKRAKVSILKREYIPIDTTKVVEELEGRANSRAYRMTYDSDAFAKAVHNNQAIFRSRLNPSELDFEVRDDQLTPSLNYPTVSRHGWREYNSRAMEVVELALIANFHH